MEQVVPQFVLCLGKRGGQRQRLLGGLVGSRSVGVDFLGATCQRVSYELPRGLLGVREHAILTVRTKQV